MNPHAVRAAEIETMFLAGAEANLRQARGGELLRGTRWAWSTRSHEDLLRSRLSSRQALRSMPINKARILTGTRRRWLLGRRRTCVAVAAVLSPLEHYLAGDTPPPPIGLAQLASHLKDLVPEADVPHMIGVCSPSGFTPDARNCGLELPNVTLVLIEPREDGGWSVIPASPDAQAVHCALFDPEAVARKLRRVHEEIDARRADLLTGGLSASAIAGRLGLPVTVVEAAFERRAAVEPDLRVTRQGNDAMLFRGAPAHVEDADMSMVDRLRQLLSGEGNEARKINALSERRARLVQRRDRLYEDLAQLEKRDGELIKQGQEAASPAAKRRIASQIKQLRDDMNRVNAAARVLGQQVELISAHIHNLTLIQEGKSAKVPTAQEITEDAVRAEEMLEQISADAELAGSLSAGVDDRAACPEELAILQELEGPAAESPGERAPAGTEPARRVPGEQRKEPRHREPEAG